MPDAVSFTELIPQALQILEREEQPVGRRAVQDLLGLSPRQALRVMQVAGGEIHGRSLTIKPDLLAAYLMTKVDAGMLRRESERKARFADWLTRARAQHLRVPYRPVEVPDSRMQRLLNSTLDRLPPGVNFGGHAANCYGLSIGFDTAQELLEKLVAVAVALSRDSDLLVQRYGDAA